MSTATTTASPSVADLKEAAASEAAARFIIDGHHEKAGETNGRKWRLHTIELIDAEGELIVGTTFSNTIGGLAENHFGHKCRAQIRRDDSFGYRIETLEIEEGKS